MKDSKLEVVSGLQKQPKEFPKNKSGITKEIFLYVNIIS